MSYLIQIRQFEFEMPTVRQSDGSFYSSVVIPQPVMAEVLATEEHEHTLTTQMHETKGVISGSSHGAVMIHDLTRVDISTVEGHVLCSLTTEEADAISHLYHQIAQRIEQALFADR